MRQQMAGLGGICRREMDTDLVAKSRDILHGAIIVYLLKPAELGSKQQQ